MCRRGLLVVQCCGTRCSRALLVGGIYLRPVVFRGPLVFIAGLGILQYSIAFPRSSARRGPAMGRGGNGGETLSHR